MSVPHKEWGKMARPRTLQRRRQCARRASSPCCSHLMMFSARCTGEADAQAPSRSSERTFTKGVVAPLAHRPHALDRCDTVVGHQHATQNTLAPALLHKGLWRHGVSTASKKSCSVGAPSDLNVVAEYEGDWERVGKLDEASVMGPKHGKNEAQRRRKHTFQRYE